VGVPRAVEEVEGGLEGTTVDASRGTWKSMVLVVAAPHDSEASLI
jgi:hypothetical protein